MLGIGYAEPIRLERELAQTLRLPVMELIPRLARSLPHVDLRGDPSREPRFM